MYSLLRKQVGTQVSVSSVADYENDDTFVEFGSQSGCGAKGPAAAHASQNAFLLSQSLRVSACVRFRYVQYTVDAFGVKDLREKFR